MEDQNRRHGLTIEAAPFGGIPFGQSVPRYRIADKREEALFKIGKA
jgi:hypothetical protein